MRGCRRVRGKALGSRCVKRSRVFHRPENGKGPGARRVSREPDGTTGIPLSPGPSRSITPGSNAARPRAPLELPLLSGMETRGACSGRCSGAHVRACIWLMPCCPQYLLEQWVFGCLFLGWLLLVAGARAPGAALLGSATGALLVFFTPLHSGHLESLVHNAIIAASIGLVVFGLAGLALGSADYPPARLLQALALVTVVGGTLVILRIHAAAAPTCSITTGLQIADNAPLGESCFRGFEDAWVLAVLAFNVAFLALLFLLQAALSSRAQPRTPPPPSAPPYVPGSDRPTRSIWELLGGRHSPQAPEHPS
jgi:hypothetical protein